jgi:uncharacterized protein YbjT (DUF2867 family)
MELVTGATGYVGGRLIERLSEAGRPVRALAREPERLEPRAGLEVVGAELVTGEGLDRALEGCETAYYLVHSMEAAAGQDFASRDRRAAERFAGAARRAGTERIVYLGGLMPSDDPPSRHLGSRLEVERTLLESVAGSTALRASILIGAGSSSFRVLVRLVERLRVMPFPEWRERRTQPIDERDAIEYLALTPERPEAAGRSLDISGPDVVSYGEMIERIAEHMGIGRLPVGMPANATRAASAVVSALTDQPRELVRPLMESLQHDLLPRDDAAREIYGIRPRPFDRAVEHALRDWEAREELAAR